jgi:hypothetical protein
VLLYPVIFTKSATFCTTGDNIHQAYPWLYKLCTSLHKGYFPVWDANTFGGKNFAGELQTGIFYPLNILWCLVFGSAAGIDVYSLDLLVALHYLIGVIGMYRVGRVFRLAPIPAAVSALVFTFTSALADRSGYETCIFFGLALLPWSIYFLGKYYHVHGHKKYLIFSGLIAGLEILAGHLQPFFHTILICAIVSGYYEYQGRKNWKTFCLYGATNIFIILLFAFIISYPQLYYAAEYLSRCYRESGDGMFMTMKQKIPLQIYAHKFVIKLPDLITLLGKKFGSPMETIYMGVLSLFLAIFFLAKKKFLNIISEHSHFTRILLIILVVGGLSVLGYQTIFPYILYNIPFVNGIRELSRYIVLVSFSASLLVGLALTYIEPLKDWILQGSVKKKQLILSAFSLNALYLALFQKEYFPLSISIPFLLASLFFLALATLKNTSYVPAIALAFIFIDLFLNPVNYGPSNTMLYPSNLYARNRIVNSLETTYGKYRVTFDMENYALLRRNLGDIYNIQTKFGFGATVNENYFDFIYHDAPESSGIDDLLNVRYVITDKKLDSIFIFKDSTQGLKLYERKNYYPRCYWKRQLGSPGAQIEVENKATIQQLTYSDLYQKISVDCLTPDTLIFSENYYPGWTCIDNQKEVPIYLASIKNYPPLFRSIALDKGHHIIEFKYNKVFYWF